MFVDLILNYNSRDIDRLFTYRVPKDIENVKIGSRVMVEFGRGNKLVDALVYSIKEECSLKTIKDIKYVLPSNFELCTTQMSLIKSIRARYASTYAGAFSTVLPSVQKVVIDEHYLIVDDIMNFKSGEKVEKKVLKKYMSEKNISKNIDEGILKFEVDFKIKTQNSIVEIVECNFSVLSEAIDSIRANAVKQKRLLEHIFGTKKQDLRSLVNATNSTRRDVLKLKEMKLVNITSKLANVDISTYSVLGKNIMQYELSSEQSAAYKLLRETYEQKSCYRALINGVTGSGKTRLYMQLAKDMLDKSKQVLILLPEISLTPQIIGVFKANLSEKIAVIHNQISDREKQNQFDKISNAEVDIIIGARSALFAPFKNLALIIMDEAHENSFASDQTPRYDARELCFDLSLKHNISLIYGSATPSISLLYLAKTNFLMQINMKRRIGNAILPTIKLVDMRNPVENNISNELISSMQLRFDRKEQVILLHNRKGYASFLQCKVCGEVTKCLNCDIPMKVHNFGKELVCHYCGYKKPILENCDICSERYKTEDIKGIGVEQYIEIFKQIFPDVKFDRIDADSVGTQTKLIDKLEKFREGDIDCLIGTQIVAKGLDFPNVTLIGILESDQLTNMNDYMAMERAFQLITQVSGRAGRHEKKGLVLIQTYQPDLDIYKYILKNDFDGFVKREMKIREILGYPPYTKLYLIVVRAEKEKIAMQQINRVFEALDYLKKRMNLKLEIYHPSSNYMAKLKNRYIFNILMKGDKSEYNKVVNMLYILNTEFWSNIKIADSQLYFDFNPVMI